MYAAINFKRKKELIEAVKAGKKIGIYSPGPFPAPTDGRSTIEGPWFPKPHTWYAEVYLKDGIIIKVK